MRKVIQINPDQKRIIVNRETAKRLNKLKGIRTNRKKGQWSKESDDAVIMRLITLVETATQMKKELE